MCGITGYFNLKRNEGIDAMRTQVTRMNDSITHRGPDSSAIWIDHETGIAFGHRRLAIIDLSPAGAQPMHSADGRFVITYNGEVFNYRALATELRTSGHKLTGDGDTAAMLAGISAWGLPALLQKIDGQFAFALWDRQERTLTLVRDRSGIKPLYWCKIGGAVLFGSELRSLRQHPACPSQIDRTALTHYFRAGNVPSPQCILRDVYKLPPAHFLTINAAGDTKLIKYWDLMG
jgi:asparagine synthase (glutamine-hydrolysing)